jgi:two-component system response regulator
MSQISMSVSPSLPRVVLAEDSEDDRALAFRALRKVDSPLIVQIAPDGQEALRILLESSVPPPQLIVLDLKMPLVSGIDVLKRVRSLERFACIPVIMMTSSDEPSDIAACRRLGADGYVRKPVDFEEYLDVVSSVAQYWIGHGRSVERGPHCLLSATVTSPV